MVNDRGRLALLIALCTLAGVAVGFGLSTMIANSRGPWDRGARGFGAASRSYLEREMHVPSVVLPKFEGYGFDCHHRHCQVHGGGWQVQLDDLNLGDLADLDDLANLRHLGDWLHKDDDVAWLGVSIVSADSGARVIHVANGSPADQAGLKADDVIVAVDGESVGTSSKLVRLVRGAEPGDEVTLQVKRGGDGQAQPIKAHLASLSAAPRPGRSR